jgi:tetratricopeptide (TPR) repeat protein
MTMGLKEAQNLREKAWAEYKTNKNSSALKKALSNAMQVAPADPKNYLQRANYYYDYEHNYSAAYHDYKQALILSPKDEVIRKRLDICAKALSGPRAAVEQVTQNETNVEDLSALTKLPFEAIRLKGYRALQANDLTFAIAALSHCVKLRPNDPSSRRYLAFALLCNGQVESGLAQVNVWTHLSTVQLSEKISFGKALGQREGNDLKSTRLYFDSLAVENSADCKSLLTIARACSNLEIYDGPTLKALNFASHSASESELKEIDNFRQLLEEKMAAAMKNNPQGNSGPSVPVPHPDSAFKAPQA